MLTDISFVAFTRPASVASTCRGHVASACRAFVASTFRRKAASDVASACGAVVASAFRRKVALRLALALTVGALTVPPAASAQTAGDYVIGPQDVLAIQVFDQADLGGKYTVETDGTFSFPLIGRVTAGGMTLRNLETELKKKLADGYFRNPQVTVGVEQYRSQRVFVMGEVRNPGPVPLTGGMTLIEALARAGSTLASASGEVAIVRNMEGAGRAAIPGSRNEAEIVRASIHDLESGSMNHNIELRDGD